MQPTAGSPVPPYRPGTSDLSPQHWTKNTPVEDTIERHIANLSQHSAAVRLGSAGSGMRARTAATPTVGTERCFSAFSSPSIEVPGVAEGTLFGRPGPVFFNRRKFSWVNSARTHKKFVLPKEDLKKKAAEEYERSVQEGIEQANERFGEEVAGIIKQDTLFQQKKEYDRDMAAKLQLIGQNIEGQIQTTMQKYNGNIEQLTWQQELRRRKA